MNPDQAAQVRFWCVRTSATWRELAALWVEMFGEDELVDKFRAGWAGNQLAGMELEERARAVLGHEAFE